MNANINKTFAIHSIVKKFATINERKSRSFGAGEQTITGVLNCYMTDVRRRYSMSNSLQQHGLAEVNQQLRLRIKKNGLETIKVHVTRRAGKYKYSFTGAAEEVVKAEAILAAWA